MKQKSMLPEVLKITSPVFFGYISIGIPFGLMMVNAGYPWWIAVLMSLLMFTGSGQYFAVGLFASGAGIWENVLVQFLLSIRHFFYGLSLINKYKGTGAFKPYLLFGITDETFAITSSTEVPESFNKGKFYFLITIFDQSYWVLGTLIGSVGYSILQKYNLSHYLEGIDFALTALFVVLLIEQIKKTKDIVPVLVGAAFAGLTVVLFKFGLFESSNIIWVSICCGLGVMLLFRGPKFFKEESAKLNQNYANYSELKENQQKEEK